MRTSAMARLGIIGILTVGLMIPLAMVEGVVSERASRRDGAVEEIGWTWGRVQTLGGPILTVPYHYWHVDREGQPPRRAQGSAHFLPEVLEIRGTVEPEVRHRSLFKVIVYRSRLTVAGRFLRPNLATLRPAPDEVQWENAWLSLGISDPRSITRRVTLRWDGRQEAFAPGVGDVGLYGSGVQAPARGLSSSTSDIPFSLEIELNGSRELRFLPAGNETSVTLTSSWPHPSFVGAPLPESHQTDGAGYAILFIVMTFVISFLWEIVGGALLHPIQYLFVGFAMAMYLTRRVNWYELRLEAVPQK